MCEAQERSTSILPTIHLSQDSVSWVLLNFRQMDIYFYFLAQESVSIWPALPLQCRLSSFLPEVTHFWGLWHDWCWFSLPLVYFDHWDVRTSSLGNPTQCSDCTHSAFYVFNNHYELKPQGGWRDGSARTGICCSYRGLGFSFQHHVAHNAF